MDCEAKTLDDQQPTQYGPVRGTINRVGDIVEMSFDLLELQAELAAQNARSSKSQLLGATVAGVVAVSLVVSGLPVLTIGLSNLLSSLLDIPLWVAQITTGIGCLASAAVFAAFGWTKLKGAGDAFKSSRLEALENIRWLRRMVQESLRREV